MEPTIRPGDKAIVNKMIIGPRIYKELNFAKKYTELNCLRLRGYRTLRHNDIVVFNFPFHNGKVNFDLNHVYIKRCIALPGDSISIVNGFYYNNNFHKEIEYVPTQRKLSQIRDSNIDSTILMKKHYDTHYSWTIKNMPQLYIPRKGDIINITPKEAYLYKIILEWETKEKIKIDWEKNIVFAGKKVIKKHTFLNNYIFVVGDNVMDSQDSRYWGVIPEEYIIGVVGFIIH